MYAAKQGAFDALCGVYAIINSLDLVGLRRPKSLLHRQLFEHLLGGFTGEELKFALHHGIEAADLLRIGRRGGAWLKRRHAVCLTFRRPFHQRPFANLGDYLVALRRLTNTDGAAVIVRFDIPSLSHWSIARRVLTTEILLRDSLAFRSLEMSRFSLDEGRYRLHPEDTLVIRRVGVVASSL